MRVPCDNCGTMHAKRPKNVRKNKYNYCCIPCRIEHTKIRGKKEDNHAVSHDMRAFHKIKAMKKKLMVQDLA